MQTSKVGKYKIQHFSREEFLNLKKEIFVNKIYDVELGTKSPVIIDAGAYIGLSTLYFKSRWPDAKVVAIEPNGQVVEILKENLSQNGFDDVQVIEAALSAKEGRSDYFLDGGEKEWNSTASLHKGTWVGNHPSEQISVKAIKLSTILEDKVDLLKLDVEGSEQAVLKEAGESLKNVQNIIVEYHPVKWQSLKKIEALLRKAGFIVNVDAPSKEGLVMIHGTR